MRRFLTLASVVAVLPLVIGPPSLHAQDHLRIVTLNAEWLVANPTVTTRDPWGDDFGVMWHIEHVASVIETLRPDILNLVEVINEPAADSVIAVLQEKGLTDYQAFFINSNDSGTLQDITLITRLTPLMVEGVQIRKFFSGNLSGPWRQEYTFNGNTLDTGISKNVVYYFEVNGFRLGFLGLHLAAFPNRPDRNAQRQAQAQVGQKIIMQEILSRGFLPIVLGDFNDFDSDVPDHEGSVSLTNVLPTLKNLSTTDSGDELVNVASLIARQEDRWTSHFDENGNGELDDSDPLTMIDHILIHESLVGRVERVFIDHGHTRAVTDHYAVVLDLDLGAGN